MLPTPARAATPAGRICKQYDEVKSSQEDFTFLAILPYFLCLT